MGIPEEDRATVCRNIRQSAAPADAVRQLMCVDTRFFHFPLSWKNQTNFVGARSASRMRSLFIESSKKGKLLTDAKFVSKAAVLVPRIEKVTPERTPCMHAPLTLGVSQTFLQFMSLSHMNRTVHLPTYNTLIGEESRKLAPSG